jgi:hypothetical protein
VKRETQLGSRARNCSMKRTDLGRSELSGVANSGVAPASANAATRSAMNPRGPTNEIDRASSSGTAAMASFSFPPRYSSGILSARASPQQLATLSA